MICRQSAEKTSNPNEACLKVAVIDSTINLNSLPFWNSGVNHVILNLGNQSVTNYSKAIVVSPNFSKGYTIFIFFCTWIFFAIFYAFNSTVSIDYAFNIPEHLLQVLPRSLGKDMDLHKTFFLISVLLLFRGMIFRKIVWEQSSILAVGLTIGFFRRYIFKLFRPVSDLH